MQTLSQVIKSSLLIWEKKVLLQNSEFFANCKLYYEENQKYNVFYSVLWKQKRGLILMWQSAKHFHKNAKVNVKNQNK